MLIAQVVLRPSRPRYRLLPITGQVARKAMVLTGVIAGISVIGPHRHPLCWFATAWPGPRPWRMALILLTASAALAAFTVHVLANGMQRVLGAAGRNLFALLGTVLAVGFDVLWGISIVLRQFGVFTAVLTSIGVIGAYAMIDATLGLETGRDVGTRTRMVRRTFRIGALFLMPYVLGEVWFARSGALPMEFWTSVRLAILDGGGTAFAGFVAWELTDYWAARSIGQTPRIDPFNPSDDEAEMAPASRLATFFPMARVLMAIVITLIAGLLALSNLGVNIAPLLAGAGVFGLAISFGSQSLIRDILSGAFFLGDDAFRVGEYIDTGRLKGTVEQISLRSLRLRHQNGQVHTIPYGQLQAITNFSRDWATMKFNLRIDPNVDLEHVRKTVKKVGARDAGGSRTRPRSDPAGQAPGCRRHPGQCARHPHQVHGAPGPAHLGPARGPQAHPHRVPRAGYRFRLERRDGTGRGLRPGPADGGIPDRGGANPGRSSRARCGSGSRELAATAAAAGELGLRRPAVQPRQGWSRTCEQPQLYGSAASRRPSPMKLKARTTRMTGIIGVSSQG